MARELIVTLSVSRQIVADKFEIIHVSWTGSSTLALFKYIILLYMANMCDKVVETQQQQQQQE